MKIDKILSNQVVSTLEELIGSNFRYIGSPNTPDYLVNDNFVIGTDNKCIYVMGDIDEFDLPNGEEFTASFMFIQPADDAKVKSTIESGNLFLTNQKSLITGISIIRETISAMHEGKETWKLHSDYALVIHLEAGDLVIRLSSLLIEVMVVDFLQKADLANIESLSTGYIDTLFTQYHSTREILSIAELDGSVS